MTEHGPANDGGVGRVGATLSVADATASRWHAIVVGAGPAGSATALRLAARGLRVLLVDAASMPRPKVCGCCLSGTALRELASLERATGCGRWAPRPIVPLARVRLATPAVSAVVPLRDGGVLSRERLDAAVVRGAIATGAAWLPGARVSAAREGDGGVEVELVAGGDRPVLPAAIVILTTGLADGVQIASTTSDRGEFRPAAGRIGLGATLAATAGGPPPGELVMAVCRHGYCGIVRLEDSRIDVAAAVDPGLVKSSGSPAAAIQAILSKAHGDRLAGLAAAVSDGPLLQATLRGTPPLTRSLPPATASGRILRVGDAAGYVEPFTGEGIGWALLSARLLDEAIGTQSPGGHGLDVDVTAIGRRYAALHGGHVSMHHARCRRVALAVRRPWLIGSAVRLARLAPSLAGRVAPLVVGAAPPWTWQR